MANPTASIVANIADGTDPTRLLKVNADGTINANSDTNTQYLKGSLGTLRETCSRLFVRDNSVTIGTTGLLWSYPLVLFAGDVITKIATRSGGTAAVAPTHYWFALYTPAGALVDQTADQTNTAWGTDTTKDLALGLGSYTVPATGLYRVAILMTAGTMITVNGQKNGQLGLMTGIVTGMAALAQTHDSGLTTTAPVTLGTPTAVDGFGYFALHS